jgi:hypothetical protein
MKKYPSHLRKDRKAYLCSPRNSFYSSGKELGTNTPPGTGGKRWVRENAR